MRRRNALSCTSTSASAPKQTQRQPRTTRAGCVHSGARRTLELRNVRGPRVHLRAGCTPVSTLVVEAGGLGPIQAYKDSHTRRNTGAHTARLATRSQSQGLETRSQRPQEAPAAPCAVPATAHTVNARRASQQKKITLAHAFSSGTCRSPENARLRSIACPRSRHMAGRVTAQAGSAAHQDQGVWVLQLEELEVQLHPVGSVNAAHHAAAHA